MNEISICVESIYDGQFITGPKKLIINNDIITAIETCDIDTTGILRGILIPGFIDTQINGGGGYLFNRSPNKETLIKISQAHQAFGTTGWLPTLITDTVEKMQSAADAIAEVLSDESINTGILGIHFEGPHLSRSKKGIHQDQFTVAQQVK